MKNRKQTQVIQWKENKIPASIKVGRVLLRIGAVLFLLGSVLSFAYWIVCFIGHWVDFGPDWSDVFPPLAFWDQPADVVDIVSDAFLPAIYVAMFLSGIGAFSYLKDKGPFINWVAWAALIGVGIFLFELMSELRDLVMSPSATDWGSFVLGMLFLQIDALFYSTGWMLAKNWLD